MWCGAATTSIGREGGRDESGDDPRQERLVRRTARLGGDGRVGAAIEMDRGWGQVRQERGESERPFHVDPPN